MIAGRFGKGLLAACVTILLIAGVASGRPGHGGSARLGRGHARAGVCAVPGTDLPLARSWHPGFGRAIAYARRRRGDIAFAVRGAHFFYGYRPTHVEWSASVLKAMLMVAYLDRPSVAGRPLNRGDQALLVPMITRSDNAAAGTVLGIVGDGGLYALAHRVGMTQFATAPVWGMSHITAADQTKFFLNIESFIVARHRSFAMRLLASIVPWQRWGIGQVSPPGWRVFFKGGWGSGTGLIDHQVALFIRGCARFSVAVLSMYDGSHAYGKETLRGIFGRLLIGLPPGRQEWGVKRHHVLRPPSGILHATL